jgi:hypothetical protein
MTRDLTTLNIDGWPLPNDYLVEVGRIALMWARLETLVMNSVANFSGLENLADPRNFIVYSRPNFGENIQLLEALCDHLLPTNPNLHGYQQVLDQLRDAQGAMALYTRGGMNPNPGTGAVEMDLPDPASPGRTLSRQVQIADLRRAMMVIDEAQHALYKLLTAIERPDRKISR